LDAEPPNADSPEPSSRGPQNFSRQFAMAMELPFVLVSATLVGAGLGYLLDRWLHTKPVFLLLFGGLGFFAGVRELLRRLPSGENGNR